MIVEATILVFILTYLGIIRFTEKKMLVVWMGVFLLAFVGTVTLDSALGAINWNVIGLYLGMLFISLALTESKIPDEIATWLVNKTNHVSKAMLILCAATGLLSIVLDNVTCILIAAPIIFSTARKINTSPVPMMIGAAISSNLQGVATLIGDPPSMILGGYAGLKFTDFFFFKGHPSMFFAVQTAMIASLFVLYLFFKRYDHRIEPHQITKATSRVPLFILLGLIATLATVSRFDRWYVKPAVVTPVFGLLAIAWLIHHHVKNEKSLIHTIKKMDWSTILFIVGIFILVDSLRVAGVIDIIAQTIYSITGNNVLMVYVTIVVLSVIFSAFIDNIPYTIAMLPVAQMISIKLGIEPYLLYFGLLIGASVGGNITPIGASANIVGVGLLEHKGHKVSFWEFVKMGLPFTLAAVSASSVFVWVFFS